VDIYPTLLNLVCSTKPNDIDGTDLSPPTTFDSRPAYIRSCGTTLGGRKNWSKAVRSDGYKLVRYPDREWEDELYDVTADPTELTPENKDNERVVWMLESEFPAKNLEQVGELDNKEQLKRLGYL
jgi:arylsulfatase A-like enzyme